MLIPVEFAMLHSPHFHITGNNLSVRLDVREKRELVLKWDTEEKELLVTFNGRTAHVPASNVQSYFPLLSKKAEALQDQKLPTIGELAATAKAVNALNAQVSTPQSHVHAGPGAGTTGQETPKGKGK